MANILVLTPRYPYPIEAGDTLRIYNLCKELSSKHSLTLLSLCNSREDFRQQPDGVFDRIERVYHPKWKSWYQSFKAFLKGEPLQLGYFRSEAFASRTDDLLGEHDLALAHLIRTGQYIKGCSDVPTVLEMTDAFSLNYKRVASLNRWSLKELLYRIEAPRAYRYERSTVYDFDLVSLVSDVDRSFLINEGQKNTEHVGVYTNGIDLESRSFSLPSGLPNMAFIGNMRTVHNQASCDYFIQRILPLVREEVSEATFKIIGSAPESIHKKYEDNPGVQVTGWVDSITEAAGNAFCGIGVMRVGCGLQNKILEYMALGLPVIANEIGVEGIDLNPGTEAWIAESPEEIAALLVDLYQDQDCQTELARAAREFVERHHTWETALRPFVEDVNRLLGKHEK
ncbi:glycosyltransferase family 4 protein [Salinibacter ruber]|uniref:Glycosyltransferase involved in cell wall biosynthesis n=1 Tax=Salinibacter ruber TaxID=146919 RepID=A0A9X2ZRE8_9BACT|nr:glycosyltransferase family 4 protein [Salinibacter ruber]MCS3950917.1 glycosyltransferase involved in cell wall biosynthesis [Salinibacter ruber]